MSMDLITKPQGVPVSATQASPKASLLSSSSGSSSFPIRAPLTVDSDSDANSDASDNNGFESDGFLSDEVKFDNDIEKPVASLDDEISGDEESVVSKPFDTHPNEEISEESIDSSNEEKKVVSSPFVTHPNEEISEESIGSSNEEKKVVSSPFVTHPNKKVSEEKDSSSGNSSNVERKVVSGLSVFIPDKIVAMKRVISRRFLAVNGESLVSPLVEEVGGKDVGGDEEFVVPSPFATRSGEKNSEEKESSSGSSNGSYVEKKVVSGPYFSIPDKITKLNRVVSRRSLAVNGESLASPLVEEENGKDVGKIKLVDDITLSLPSPGITPIAKLSGDSDEDSGGSGLEEDDGFSGEDMIPVLQTLEKLSDPKDQVLGVKEGDLDEDGLQFKPVLESEVFEGLVSSEHLNGVLGGVVDMSIVENDSLKDDNLGGLVKDGGPHIGGDVKATSLVESEVSLMSGSSVMDEVAEYYPDEEILGLENMEQVDEFDDTDSIYRGHNVSLECTSATQGETAVNSIESKEVMEGGQYEDAGTDESSSVIYFPINTSFQETDKVVPSTVECEFVDMAELGAKLVKTADEKNVSETHGEEVHKRGGLVAIERDIKDNVCKENAEEDEDVNVDVICVYDLKCGTNGSHVNESEKFSLESRCEKVESIMEQDADFSNGQIPRSSYGGLMEDELCCKSISYQPGSLGLDSDHLEVENENQVAHDLVQLKEEEKGSCSEDYVEGLTLGESNTLENIVSEMKLVFTSHSISGGDSSHDHSKIVDDNFITEEDDDPAGKSEVYSDSAVCSGLPDVARGSETDNSIAIIFSDDSGILSLEHSADLNSTIGSTELTSHTDHLIFSTSTELDSKKIIAEGEKNKLDVQQIRVKYLRLVQRLRLSAENSIAAQVLNCLDLAIGRSSSLEFSQETAKREAVELELDDTKSLDFSLNILIIGKSGVGKSATINSIFGEEKTIIDPFEAATTAVKEIVGTVDGIKVRVLDTPGLGTSLKDQSLNKKILKSIERFTKKCPPDVVFYVDRLDMQSQDLNDMPLLRSITSSLGSSLWHKTFIALTHAASTPPDGPSGEPLSYEKFVALRSHVIQQLISHAIGDQNMVNAGVVNPVCLVENQGLCNKSRDGQALLPNGEAWKPRLLLLCYSAKILSELNSTIKAYKTLDVNKLFDVLVPSPPLPYLSSLLQSCDNLKYSADQCEEELAYGKRLVLVGSSGAVQSHGNAGYGANFEMRSRLYEYPFEQDQITMTLALMPWRCNLIWGCDMQSPFSAEWNRKLMICSGLNSKVTVRISSSEQFQIPLVVLLSIVRSIFSKFIA